MNFDWYVFWSILIKSIIAGYLGWKLGFRTRKRWEEMKND